MLDKTIIPHPTGNGQNGKAPSPKARAFAVAFIPDNSQLQKNILLLWAEALSRARRDITRATSEIHRMLGNGEIDPAGLMEVLSDLDTHHCDTLADELMSLATLATMGSELSGVPR